LDLAFEVSDLGVIIWRGVSGVTQASLGGLQ